jgi:hypothetical protein
VHVNNNYADITKALESGKADALLVVGQMFKVGDTESSAMTAIGAKLSTKRRAEEGVETAITATDMLGTRSPQHTRSSNLLLFPTCFC